MAANLKQFLMFSVTWYGRDGGKEGFLAFLLAAGASTWNAFYRVNVRWKSIYLRASSFSLLRHKTTKQKRISPPAHLRIFFFTLTDARRLYSFSMIFRSVTYFACSSSIDKAEIENPLIWFQCFIVCRTTLKCSFDICMREIFASGWKSFHSATVTIFAPASRSKRD